MGEKFQPFWAKNLAPRNVFLPKSRNFKNAVHYKVELAISDDRQHCYHSANSLSLTSLVFLPFFGLLPPAKFSPTRNVLVLS